MSNIYKDASERLAQEMRTMSFNDMVKYVNNLQESNGSLTEKLLHAEDRIHELDTDPLVVDLREQLEAMETVADMWVDIANDLFEGLLIAEGQLAKANIGLRPLAQKAKKAFIELTEESDDEG